jgi:hypothetical protein
MNDTKRETTEPRARKNQDKNGEATDPVHTVREGAVAASIWLRQSPPGLLYYDFSLSRSWKSMNTGKTGYSKNFFARNRDDLIRVVEKASAWIEEQHLESLSVQDEAASMEAA